MGLTLRYSPTDTRELHQVLDLKLTRVTMDKSPLGIQAHARGDVGYSRSPMDDATQAFEMILSLANVEQKIMQSALEVPEKSQTRVNVSALGAPRILVEESTEDGPQILGIPIRMLALLCHVIRFSEEKVNCGSTWSVNQELDTHSGEPMSVGVENMLLALNNASEAVIQSEVEASIGYFETPNPLGYGPPMPVKDAKMRISTIQRVFDMQQSVVTGAKGKLFFSGDVDLGGKISRMTAEGAFTLKTQPERPQQDEPSGTERGDSEEEADQSGQAPSEANQNRTPVQDDASDQNHKEWHGGDCRRLRLAAKWFDEHFSVGPAGR